MASVKVTQGSFHQGNERFGSTAGRQCTCCALFSVGFSIIKNPGYWDTKDINYIVEQGDRLYKKLNRDDNLGISDLPHDITLMDCIFTVEFLDTSKIGFVSCNSVPGTIIDRNGNPQADGFLLIIDEKCVAVTWNKKYFFLFDSHSRNSQGKSCPEGTATLIKFSSRKTLELFIIENFIAERLGNIPYELQYISISKLNQETAARTYLKEKKLKHKATREVREKDRKRKATKEVREKDRKRKATEEVREKDRKRKANPVVREKRTTAEVKNQRKLKTMEKRNANRIKAFKDAIKEGPYFICVICNRCMYRKTVKHFDAQKYDIQMSYLFTATQSFDSEFYICLTCNQNIMKKKVPCQAVLNKLVLDDIPDELNSLNRLEKVLISKRILFKKIAIMPKGQQPKIKGSVCNIPVQVNAVTDCLPRETADDMLFVRLKRKIMFKGHVYFESVRPMFVELALTYLKYTNPFYSDILINLDNISNELLSLTDVNAMVQHDEYPLSVTHDDSCNDNEDNLEEENPLYSERVNSDEMCLIPNIYTNDSNTLDIAPGENKNPISFFNDDFCEEQAFPCLFPKGKFGYKVERTVPLSPVKYFNQRLLNYSQRFSSNSDYIFFAQYVMQQINLSNQINIATCKAKGTVSAGQLSRKSKETLRALICEDKGYTFMKSVKGTPAYFKNLLYDVLAMVKQKGLPTFFLTLSCADLRWDELLHIISKLNGIDIENEDISYFRKCELLNQNPVLTARHFQYRVETFFKEIILPKNGLFGHVESYVIKVEFQARGSPHIHAFIWVKDPPTLTVETKNTYVAFVDSLIKADLPEEESDPELFSLVNQYQTHSHSRTCRKYKNVPCRFNYGRFFTERTICAEPLPNDMDELEKESILHERSKILSKVKKFIDEFLDPHKHDFKSELSIHEILDSLAISEHDYYQALSTSPDEDFQIHLRRAPNSCFVNNYFDIGLKAWEANLDIQPVFNYFKAISYMCSYFSKSETESSVAMKKAVEESDNLDFKERMKKLAVAFLSHRQCSVQEAVYQLLPELWLRKTFPVVIFANTNLPEKRYRICKSEKELKELPEESVDVFKKNNLDRYMERPNPTFKGGKYAVLDQFCYAEFLAYYYLDTKALPAEKNDCQPEVLEDDDSEQPLVYPKIIPLMSSEDKMRCRNVKKVLRYHVPNPLKDAEAYAHHLLMLFYPFRKEKDLLCEEDNTYVSRLNQQDVLDIVNQNKAIFEPWGDLVDCSLRQFIFRPRSDTFAEQENELVENEIISEEHDNEIEDPIIDFEIEGESSTPSNFNVTAMANILPDNEINSLIRSLNDKQREVFNVVNTWARQTVISYSAENVSDIEPLQIFLTGGAGTGKSHVIKTIFASLNKTLNYKSRSIDKPKVLLLAPTGVAACNISGHTIHSALGIPVDCRGMQVPKLSNKKKCALRLKLEELKAIIIDEISMVSNKLLLYIHQRLLDIFGYSNNFDKPFAGITIIVVGDLYQLPPVLQKPVFADYFDELYNIYHLWKVFQMYELTEVMRQKGDTRFINLLNNIREGILTENNQALLCSRFVGKDDESYPIDALHIFAENEPARLHNSLMLQKIEQPIVALDAVDQIPNGVPNHVYDRILNMKPSQTNGLAFSLTLKIGAKVMLTSNIDVSDKLINGQIGTIVYFKRQHNKVNTIYVRFDDFSVGVNAQLGDVIATDYNAVPIERITTDIKTHSKKNSAPVIKRTQFPIALSWACTVHKVQGLSLDRVVISLDLLKQKSFNAGQVYVALSRATSLDGLFLIGTFNHSAIVVDERVRSEYERLRNVSALKTDCFEISGEFSIALSNVRSLRKHLLDIKLDKRFMNNSVILCTETQISQGEICNVELEGFSVLLNNFNHKFSSTAVYYKEDIELHEEFVSEGVVLVKLSNSNYTLKVLLCYRKNEWLTRGFSEMIYYLSVAHQPDLILGDFNVKPNDELNFSLNDFCQIVSQGTHLAGATLDHVYVSNRLFEKCIINVSVCSIFFSDHEMIRLSIKDLNNYF